MDAYSLFDEPFDAALEISLTHWSNSASLYVSPLASEESEKQGREAYAKADRLRTDGQPLRAAMVEFAYSALVDGVDVRGKKLFPNG
jgi:hypothetical protein